MTPSCARRTRRLLLTDRRRLSFAHPSRLRRISSSLLPGRWTCRLALALGAAQILALIADETKNADPGLLIFRDRCIACHLESGFGIEAMKAPSIAGLPRWYVSDQLRKFRSGQRGFHSEDPTGNLMHANALALDEKSIALLGRHVESLTPNSERSTIITNDALSNGKRLYHANCATCHGDHAKGNQSKRIAPLVNQQDWYLLAQIEKFNTGRRHHHGSDASKPLSAKDVHAVIAWIATLDNIPH